MIQRLTPSPKPAYPHDLSSARVWLGWAVEHGHQESCACHSCRLARRIVAQDQDALAPEDEA